MKAASSADAVRKLAERTSGVTTAISVMIGAVQNGTRSAIVCMGCMRESADQSASLANDAGEAIDRIRDGAFRVVDVVERFARVRGR